MNLLPRPDRGAVPASGGFKLTTTQLLFLFGRSASDGRWLGAADRLEMLNLLAYLARHDRGAA